VLLEGAPHIVRVATATPSAPFKTYRLVLADKAALLIALFIASVALCFWLLGIVGLWGRPQLRFDYAMIVWTIEAQVALALPVWLFLRFIGIVLRIISAWSQASRDGGRVPSARIEE